MILHFPASNLHPLYHTPHSLLPDPTPHTLHPPLLAYCWRFAPLFDLASLMLSFQPVFPGSQGWLCLETGPRLLDCFADEPYQTIHRIFAVLFLSTKAPCIDDQFTLLIHLPPGQMNQPFSHFIRKGRRTHHIEAELYRCSDFVYILPSGARRVNELLTYFPVFNRDVWRDVQHVNCSFQQRVKHSERKINRSNSQSRPLADQRHPLADQRRPLADQRRPLADQRRPLAAFGHRLEVMR